MQIGFELTPISQDKNAPTLESKGPSLKRKLDFGDLVTPRKRRILESYSTGDICQVATVYSDATVCSIFKYLYQH